MDRDLSKDEIASFDNVDLVLRLIFSYKEDIANENKECWSTNTCNLWDEVINRMKDTVVHGFDKKSYIDKLQKEHDNQAKILESAKHDYSYHYGIESGLNIAIREFKKAIRE